MQVLKGEDEPRGWDPRETLISFFMVDVDYDSTPMFMYASSTASREFVIVRGCIEAYTWIYICVKVISFTLNVSNTVLCDVTNCAQCTQENICRECNDGFELSDDGDNCIRIRDESLVEAELNVPVIIGK